MYATLHANIVAKLAELLPDHASLPYSIDIGNNKRATGKGYAVLLLDSKTPTAGVVGGVTLDTNIQIRLSDTYGPERNTDSQQLLASHVLADRCIAVFKSLAAAKLNSAGVRNVSLLDISDPTYVDRENTVYRTLTIEANLRA